ncbi:branched-chain amino acid transport system II carrier protein [Streptococcus loxodontisalivarius]|uniref:Branched-chain amino acid transport system carrier protein n=1 Tax=Streptococcus loxodontisalivarius TaxID=1349415 RepID=A0ABS2PVR4_9STRE|nr:branched-chain amino acid transport system II carrier protein [Streptococcus loxodontisalivarius]MBM7643620.1 LIVCS family branched-chain amino acid:cation transporter [Streptococcus loxodontisalivarius]
MKERKTTLIIGLMLFALFFGAGNLTYPAYMGLYSGQELVLAIIGFCLTGVTLPLLGVVAMAYSGKDNAEKLAHPISKKYAVAFMATLYLAIGPFFAIPRTGATSFSMSIQPLFGDSIWVKLIYAVIFFGLSYFLAIKPNKIADYIGKYLTPLLLLVLAILIVMSFITPAGPIGTAHNASDAISNQFASHPFIAGLIQGYGTMDALAALAFSIVVIKATKDEGAKNSAEVTRMTLRSGLIAALFLALIYIFVSRIGATSQSLFSFDGQSFLFNASAADGGNVLGQAALHYLGFFGQIILAIIVFLACLSTAVGLITSCAEYFHGLLPKVSHQAWASLFTLIATAFYFGGLNQIINWSLPVLYLLYPLTITLVLLTLSQKSLKLSPLVFQTTTAFTLVAGLYDALSTLASMTGLFTIPSPISHFFTDMVPLGAYNMGWISFALIGFVLGLILSKFQK